MKKVTVSALIVLMVSTVALAQDFWHIKVSGGALIASPGDGNGMAFGPGGNITFGYPKGNFDVGLEIRKWFRSYDVYDGFMKAKSDSGLIREGGQTNGAHINQSDAHYEDNGLSLGVNIKYKFYDITPSIGAYAGGGIGLYLIQVKRDETRQKTTTGYWQIQFVDFYLETKTQEFAFVGIEGPFVSKLDFYGEGRMAYLNNWDKWDNPYIIEGHVGLKYCF